MNPFMFEITKGNPTSEEIAALVAVLILGRCPTKPHLTSSTAGRWRRATPVDEVQPCAPHRPDRCWRIWPADWSHVAPAHASSPQEVRWTASRNVG